MPSVVEANAYYNRGKVEAGFDETRSSGIINNNAIKSLTDLLEVIPDELLPTINAVAAGAAASVVQKYARAVVRRDRGVLRRSIRTGVYRVFSGEPAVTITAGGPGARHAHLIELGTVKQPAYPFLVPAIEATLSQQFDVLATSAEQLMKGIIDNLLSGKLDEKYYNVFQPGSKELFKKYGGSIPRFYK